MKKLLLTATVIMGLMTVSCSQDEPSNTLTQATKNLISYSVASDNGSRASSNYQTGLDINTITVHSWLTAADTIVPNYAERNEGNYAYFANDVLSRTGVNGEKGTFYYSSDARYWPGSKELLDFFATVDAVAPFSWYTQSCPAPHLDWYTQGKPEDTPDMLYALTPNQICTTTNKGQQNVSLSFYHAFAKACVTAEVRNKNIRVCITDMTIKGIAKTGQFVFPHKVDADKKIKIEDAHWNIGDEFTDIPCSLAPFNTKSNPIVLDKADVAKRDLLSENNGLMLIPNNYSGRNASKYQTYIELKVFAYSISDTETGYTEGIDRLIYPSYAADGKSFEPATLIIPIEFNWRMGTINHYNIVFDCGNGGSTTPDPNNPAFIRIGYEVEVNDWITGEVIEREYNID